MTVGRFLKIRYCDTLVSTTTGSATFLLCFFCIGLSCLESAVVDIGVITFFFFPMYDNAPYFIFREISTFTLYVCLAVKHLWYSVASKKAGDEPIFTVIY